MEESFKLANEKGIKPLVGVDFRNDDEHVFIAIAMNTTVEIDAYVLNTLMRDLVGHDRRPSTFLVYLTIATASSGSPVALSHAALAERTGLSRRAVQSAVAALERRELVRLARSTRTDVALYRALTPWRRRRAE